jgi:hypothetical protein
VLWAAYLAFLAIAAALKNKRAGAAGRIAALTVGLLAAATGIGLAADARAEGHEVDDLYLTMVLAAGGVLLAAGSAVWHGTPAHLLRVAGFAATVAAMAVPSTLTLALPIAALAVPALAAVRRIG